MKPNELINFLRGIQQDYGCPPEYGEDEDPDVVLWNKCHDAITCVHTLRDRTVNKDPVYHQTTIDQLTRMT